MMFSSIAVSATVNEEPQKSPEDGVHLVLDSTKYKEMPRNFRKSTDKINSKVYKNINTKGLNTLNISGSSQFSGFSLPMVIKAIGADKKIIDIDLRQESHGFINGMPVSWMGVKNNANMGLSREEVIVKTNALLKGITLGVPLTFYNHPNITITPETVQSEKELTNILGVGYEFVPVTDGKLPTEDMVDFFIDFVKNQPKDSWLHFHCKEGIGRTTTFMILYDMMKNYSAASEQEIIQRQLALASFDKDHSDSFLNKDRVKFFSDFYKYSSKNGPEFNQSFTDFMKTQGS